MRVKSHNKKVYKKYPITESQKEVIKEVSSHMCLDEKTFMGASRVRHIVMARNMAWYIFREYLGTTVTETARIFGKDHTTIIHGIKSFKNDMQTSDTYYEHYYAIKKNLLQKDIISIQY